jgi:hypothetical protein
MMKQLGLPIADEPTARALSEGRAALEKVKRAKRGKIGAEYRRLVRRMAARLRAELDAGRVRVRTYRRGKKAAPEQMLGLDA